MTHSNWTEDDWRDLHETLGIQVVNLRQAIRSVVEKVGDPLMEHIIKQISEVYQNIWTAAEIKTEVLAMVNRGELRQKEDEVDHDWSYRKGRNWG